MKNARTGKEQVVGAFDTFGSGVHAMLDAGHQPGTFIVHHCLSPQAEKEEYYFHSNRVNFASGGSAP